MLSVIVPTFNEGENVDRLYRAVAEALRDVPFELIYADDSTDDTRSRILALAETDPRVRLSAGSSRRGLARAVVEAIDLAEGDVVAVLDADLQHPPELLPELLRTLEETGADLVVPSRYTRVGSPGGLSLGRYIVSQGARLLAYLVLKEARRTTDPLSGFFVVRRRCLEGIALSPRGWKILLEVLVRGRVARVVDVPYAFQPRQGGDSKLSLSVELDYLRHLGELFLASPESQRFWMFAVVGASGVLVNALAFWAFLHLGPRYDHFWVTLSSLLASHVAMLNNFFWNYSFTWRDQRHQSILVHFVRYWIVSEVGSAITAGFAGVLSPIFHSALWAELIGIAVAVVVTYRLTNRWVFARPAWKRVHPLRQ